MTTDNTNLHRANKAKYDEFYTRYDDVARSLDPYRKYLTGKHVYCNCDNPNESSYVKYLLDNFIELGLSKLSSTYYGSEGSTVLTKWKLGDDGKIKKKTKKLKGDGSFDSDECLKVLDKCDVVITNPPFSIFNRFFDVLRDHGKDFIIVGPMLKVQVKKFSEAMFAGEVHSSGIRLTSFICPDDYDDYHEIDNDGNKIKKVQAVVYSSFPVNLKPDFATMYKHEIDRYDDYPDIANADALKDIPLDYDGKIGVPITFLHTSYEDYYNIIGFVDPTLNGKKLFKRVVIQKKPDADF